MHLGLCQYALPTWVERHEILELVRLAARLGLNAVEFDPLRVFGRSAFGADNILKETENSSLDLEKLHPLRDEIRRLGLRVVIATGGTDRAHLRQMLGAAKVIGANVVRTVLSGVLCGEREKITGGWRAHLDKSLADFREVIGDYEHAGIALAVENHQDLTSGELVWLCEQVGSDAFGVNLDTGNPLAVGEDFFSYACRVAPFVKNIHLKDYGLLMTPTGFALFRCELGKGVLNIPGLLDLFRDRDLCVNVELAALQARPIRILDADWQAQFADRTAKGFCDLAEWARTRAISPDTDIRTAMERGASEEEIAEFELAQVETSVKFVQSLNG